MVGRLNDIVTAAFVVDATSKIHSSTDGNQTNIQNPTRTNRSAQIRPAETKPADKGEKTELNLQNFQADEVYSLKRKKELEDEKKQAGLVPGSNALNELMEKTNVNLEFDYKKEVNLMSVKMVEKGTDKVIKEFPPEEMLETMIKTRDWLGAFIDETI